MVDGVIVQHQVERNVYLGFNTGKLSEDCNFRLCLILMNLQARISPKEK